MPPKAKFTKEQIAEAGLEIIRERGAEGLTARSLAKKLGSSACPIFTVYENMDEVFARTQKSAKAVYAEYIRKGLSENPAFKGVGTQYIAFAREEPKLFQLLFMSKTNGNVENFLPLIDDNYELILRSVREPYALSEEDAQNLYTHLMIYTHGIATLVARKVVAFTDGNIDVMLTEVFTGLLKQIKGRQQ